MGCFIFSGRPVNLTPKISTCLPSRQTVSTSLREHGTPLRLVTFETFVQSDEAIWPDQKTYLPTYLPTNPPTHPPSYMPSYFISFWRVIAWGVICRSEQLVTPCFQKTDLICKLQKLVFQEEGFLHRKLYLKSLHPKWFSKIYCMLGLLSILSLFLSLCICICVCLCHYQHDR